MKQTTTVESAAQLMTAMAVAALPVVDDTGRLVGMVSESDLLWHRVPSDPTAHMRRPDIDPADRPGMVVEVMSPYTVTTQPDTDLAEVAEQMLEYDVRSMPVLDAGRPPVDRDGRGRRRPRVRRVRRPYRAGHRGRAGAYGAGGRGSRRGVEPAVMTGPVLAGILAVRTVAATRSCCMAVLARPADACVTALVGAVARRSGCPVVVR